VVAAAEASSTSVVTPVSIQTWKTRIDNLFADLQQRTPCVFRSSIYNERQKHIGHLDQQRCAGLAETLVAVGLSLPASATPFPASIDAPLPARPPPGRRSWYPVAYLKDLSPGRPTPFTLLGAMTWCSGYGPKARRQLARFADLCPHRLVPLSQGALNETRVSGCPYSRLGVF